MTVPSVRAKIQAGDKDYQVTADDVPSFLYEDPEAYNPEDVLSGFLRGYFLACVSDHYPFALGITDNITVSPSHI